MWDGKLLLNGKPSKRWLGRSGIPDGIWPLRPPTRELQADIQRSLDMGFNGASACTRKSSSPRFLSHADRMGYLVWGEYANWGLT